MYCLPRKSPGQDTTIDSRNRRVIRSKENRRSEYDKESTREIQEK